MRRAPTHRWRGGRVAEGGGLLNRYTVNPVSWVRIPSPPPPSHQSLTWFRALPAQRNGVDDLDLLFAGIDLGGAGIRHVVERDAQPAEVGEFVVEFQARLILPPRAEPGAGARLIKTSGGIGSQYPRPVIYVEAKAEISIGAAARRHLRPDKRRDNPKH